MRREDHRTSRERVLPALSSPGETIGTGQACSLRVARIFGRGFDAPRLQNFALRNFVLSKPRFQGASKCKIAMFHAYILRCLTPSEVLRSLSLLAILTRCGAGTSGPRTGCNQTFRRPRR